MCMSRGEGWGCLHGNRWRIWERFKLGRRYSESENIRASKQLNFRIGRTGLEVDGVCQTPSGVIL